MEGKIDSFSKKTVKIISQKITLNYMYPFKNKKSSSSIGSGFFIDMEGHILTCSHVIDDSKNILCEIPHIGDKKIEVEVLGLCPELDLAILKTIDYKPVDCYDLASPEIMYKIKPSSEVFVIGFPMGQKNLKFTRGIISGREDGLIQTDAPINSGNSGGPLMLNNKVIGINTSGIDNADNIGYATPINYFYLIKKQLFQKHNLIRVPRIPFLYQNSTDTMAKKCGTGVYVDFVFKKSKIKIKPGDVISKIDKYHIDNYGLINRLWFNEKMSINDYIKTIEFGRPIELTVCRGKRKFKIKMVNTEDSPLFEIDMKYPIWEKEKIDYEVFGGLVVMQLCKNHLVQLIKSVGKTIYNTKRDYLVLKYSLPQNREESRLVITKVLQNSYIDRFSILSDFEIIDKVNDTRVTTLKGFRKSVLKSKNIFKLQTEFGNTFQLPIKTLVKEEPEFSRTFKYPLGSIYKTLSKKPKKTKKKKRKL